MYIFTIECRHSNHTSHAHWASLCLWVNANLYSKLSNLCAMSIMLVACSSEHLSALVRTGSNFCGFRQWKSAWFSLEHTKFRLSSLHRTNIESNVKFYSFSTAKIKKILCIFTFIQIVRNWIGPFFDFVDLPPISY